jgi:hypothetical protein
MVAQQLACSAAGSKYRIHEIPSPALVAATIGSVAATEGLVPGAFQGFPLERRIFASQ